MENLKLFPWKLFETDHIIYESHRAQMFNQDFHHSTICWKHIRVEHIYPGDIQCPENMSWAYVLTYVTYKTKSGDRLLSCIIPKEEELVKLWKQKANIYSSDEGLKTLKEGSNTNSGVASIKNDTTGERKLSRKLLFQQCFRPFAISVF